MVGIDAKVVLGLAGKMGQVFIDEGAYQAFPLAPIGLKVDSLRALVADEFGTGAAAHAQFSLLVNQIPTGRLWHPEGATLWDVYGDILSRAELLKRPRKPRQQRAYDRAFDVLYDTGEPPVPSAAVVAYERYRDAYLAEAMEYNNRKGMASLAAADPGVTAAWEADEPALRGRVQDAAAAWSGPGKRAEVDEARRVLRDLGSDSPQVAWAGYRKLFDPDLPEIFFRTSADGLSYLPTSYMPSDVADVAWPRITVSADELRALAESAPEDLRDRLGSSSESGISRVSFEYSYVTVSRPWFSPQVFESTAWRFREPGRVLSDGGSPPRGECTAYVTGLVLARNITVQHTTADDSPTTVDLGFLPNLAVMTQLNFHTLATVEATDAPPDRLEMVVLDDPAGWGTVMRLGEMSHAVAEPEPTPTVTTTLTGRGRMMDRLRASTTFASLRNPALQVTAIEPTPEASAPDETATAPDEIYVLALQCRLLPASPAADHRRGDGDGDGDARGQTYVVASGDTLAKIAAMFYGDPAQWPRIHQANLSLIGADADVLEIGYRLTIP